MKRGGRAPKADATVARVLSESYRKIYTVIVAIPRGKVMTYGQVAEAAGLGRSARLVGYALRASPGTFRGKPVPWQRVLGAKRRGVAQVAIKDPLFGTEQRIRLEAERVTFSPSGGVDLTRFGHRPWQRKAR